MADPWIAARRSCPTRSAAVKGTVASASSLRHAAAVGIKLRTVSLNLPFGIGGVEMDVSDVEARAAWALYVELATRVAAHPLEPGAGSVREALDSLYSLFGSTREVLREAGSEVAQGRPALGPLAIDMLNKGLRPFVLRWHTELGDDDTLAAGRREDFDRELADLHTGLAEYVQALAKIAGIRE